MAGSKESSRQKLIGLMYLVLTALLALNVSREVLDAFNNITRGIDQTLQTTHAKNAKALDEFKLRVDNSNGDSMALVCWSKLQTALEKTTELNAFIERVKKEAVEAESSQDYSGSQTSFLGSGMTVLVEQDNVDIASRMLADPHHPKYQYGRKLKELINTTKSDLVALFNDMPEMKPEEMEAISKAITIGVQDDPENPNPDKRTWEYATFKSVPLGAALAVLTKIQNDVRNTESEVINRLYKEIGGEKPVIKGLQAMVTPRSTAVALGEKFEADIFMGAQVGAILPDIEVDGQNVPLDGSIGKYTVATNQPGSFEKEVTIHFKNAESGKVESYTTTMQYDVFRTSAIVSADAMNVLYLGLKNPVSVSVPGYEPERVSATLSPSGIGKLEKVSPGKYLVHLTKRSATGAKIYVTVRSDDGTVKQMPATVFRTKKVPAPYANVLNKSGGEMSIAACGVARNINATLDVNFPFDGVGYKVISYDYVYRKKRGNTVITGTTNSSQIKGELRASMQNAARGDMLVISNIRAQLRGSAEVANLPGALVFDIN